MRLVSTAIVKGRGLCVVAEDGRVYPLVVGTDGGLEIGVEIKAERWNTTEGYLDDEPGTEDATETYDGGPPEAPEAEAGATEEPEPNG